MFGALPEHVFNLVAPVLQRMSSVALDALKKCSIFSRGLENGRFPVLVFGPESVSYERSRHENRTILREISARAFL